MVTKKFLRNNLRKKYEILIRRTDNSLSLEKINLQ